MPRTKGAKDGPSVERTYHKTSDYWDRPTLADLLRDSDADYAELRAAALAAGYSINSFYQTMSEMRSEGGAESADPTAGWF